MYATRSRFLSRSITISPITRDDSSALPELAKTTSISSMFFSILPMGRGLLAQAFFMLDHNLSRLKSSLRPSRLTTIKALVCTFSYVVKRKPHLKHSLRRRILSPESRESITFESSLLQKGQYIETFFVAK